MSGLTTNFNDFSLQLKKNWGWFTAIGVILLLLGLFALSYQFFATVFSIYIIAILLIIAGLAQAIHAFRIRGLAQTTLWAVIGILYIVAGIIAFIQPINASIAITLMIAFLLIASGITQIISSLTHQNFPRWGWWLFSGIMTFLLGILIVFGWPVNSLWVLGMFLGIDLIFQGWAYILIGFALKSHNE